MELEVILDNSSLIFGLKGLSVEGYEGAQN